MKERIKKLQDAMEKVATEFYKESGARMLSVEIRISPWETTHKFVLEFYGESGDAGTGTSRG